MQDAASAPNENNVSKTRAINSTMPHASTTRAKLHFRLN